MFLWPIHHFILQMAQDEFKKIKFHFTSEF